MDLAQAQQELARKFFKWSGPASIQQFAGFAAVSQKAAKAATEGLGLVPAWPDSALLLLPEDVDAFNTFTTPKKPVYKLISGIDSLVYSRHDASSFVDAADESRPILKGQGGPSAPGRDGSTTT